VASIEAAVDAIIARLKAAESEISKASIWPDMLNEMLGQTKTGMGAIQDVFASTINGSQGIVPMLQAIKPNITAAVGSGALGAGAQTQSYTIPVSVYLDGQQISTLMQKRLVKTMYQNLGRARRTTVIH
jgi:hypothetical protein